MKEYSEWPAPYSGTSQYTTNSFCWQGRICDGPPAVVASEKLPTETVIVSGAGGR